MDGSRSCGRRSQGGEGARGFGTGRAALSRRLAEAAQWGHFALPLDRLQDRFGAPHNQEPASIDDEKAFAEPLALSNLS